MKKIVLFIICIVAAAVANSQTPALQWAKGFIGADYSQGNSVSIDGAGNVYSTGWFQGTTDFNPGTGVFNLTSLGGEPYSYISKLNSSGNFVWTKSFGGNYDTYTTSITTDTYGNSYTTGSFSGTVDFNPGAGVDTLTSSAAGCNIFILKLDASGNFVWAKNIGGVYSNIANSIAIDPFGGVYTTGSFSGTVDFDPGAGVYNLTSGGPGDNIFISKLDIFGNFVWAKNYAGFLNSQGNSISSDALGNVYTTGSFNGKVDFDPGAGVFNLTASDTANNPDIFISKLDASGNFVWAKTMGGSGISQVVGSSVTVDELYNVYSTGVFYGTIDFDPNVGVYDLASSAGSGDAFVFKLDASGNLSWCKHVGGNFDVGGSSVVIDAFKNIYTAGNFQGTADFDPGVGIFNLTGPSGNIYISKLDAFGNFIWAENIGGADGVYASSMVLDSINNIYIEGSYNGTVDFDPGSGTYNLAYTGGLDIFTLKLYQTPLGINEIADQNTISIYPNPSNGIFNIAVSGLTKPSSIEVYNSMGVLVLSQKIVNEQNMIELTDEANGLYFVKVVCENKIIGAKKIMKE